MTIGEIVKHYSDMEVETPKWLNENKRDRSAYIDREKKDWLVKELISLVEQGKLKKLVSEEKDLVFLWERLGSETFVVMQKLRGSCGSRYAGGKTYDYKLTIFSLDGKEILSLTDFCDESCYDSRSYLIPIMDLYDVLVFGKKRKPPTAHDCGLSGFNPHLGDSCPACEEASRSTTT